MGLTLAIAWQKKVVVWPRPGRCAFEMLWLWTQIRSVSLQHAMLIYLSYLNIIQMERSSTHIVSVGLSFCSMAEQTVFAGNARRVMNKKGYAHQYTNNVTSSVGWSSVVWCMYALNTSSLSPALNSSNKHEHSRAQWPSNWSRIRPTTTTTEWMRVIGSE